LFLEVLSKRSEFRKTMHFARHHTYSLHMLRFKQSPRVAYTRGVCHSILNPQLIRLEKPRAMTSLTLKLRDYVGKLMSHAAV